MAVESVDITKKASKRRSFINDWRERNDSRIKEWRHSVRLFSKSPLAVLGLLIVLAFIIVALLAPFIITHDPYTMYWDETFLPPGGEHILGTDHTGRDIFSRLIMGSQVSLYIGILVVGISVAVGTLIGCVSGYYGGKIDELVMRITDIFLAFPSLILAMVIAAALGKSIENVMLAMTLVWWPAYARIVRGQALFIREQKYIEAAKSIGASNWRVMTRHLLPNSISPIVVQSTMDFGNVVLTAAGLSFIGFGAKYGQAEWGWMVAEGQHYILGYWWIITFPGLAILIVCLGFNLFGDGIRDILDPKMRR